MSTLTFKSMTAEQATYIARRRPETARELDMVHQALRVLAREAYFLFAGRESLICGAVESDIQRRLSVEEIEIVMTEIGGLAF